VEDIDFSDAFCRFVQVQLPSVDVAELLLVAFHEPDVAWQARAAVERLPAGVNMAEADAAKHLQAFQAAGLLDSSLRYRPASEELGGFVQTLAKAYEERPVTLIRLIYALRDRKIRSFADAFKLRKD
jgi:hypothetical protein